MRSFKKEDGYSLDGFVVPEDAEVIFTDEIHLDEIEADNDIKKKEQVTKPRSTKRSTISPAVITTTGYKVSKKKQTDKIQPHDEYDSDDLDAIIGPETDKSESEDDISDFAPDDASDDEQITISKRGLTPKVTPLTTKQASSSNNSTKNSDGKKLTALPNTPEKKPTLPQTEVTATNSKKRARNNVESDNSDDDYTPVRSVAAAAATTAAAASPVKRATVSGNSRYRALAEAFDLMAAASPAKKRK